MGNPMHTEPVSRRGRTDSDNESRPQRRLRPDRTHHNENSQRSGVEIPGREIPDSDEDNAEHESIAESPRSSERTRGRIVDIETPSEGNTSPDTEIYLQRIRRRHFGLSERSSLPAATPPFNERESDLAMLVSHLRQQVLQNRIANGEPASGTTPSNHQADSTSRQSPNQQHRTAFVPGSLSPQGRDSVTRPVPALTWCPPIMHSSTRVDMAALSRLRNHLSRSHSSAHRLSSSSPQSTASNNMPQGVLRSASRAGVLSSHADRSSTSSSMIPRAQNTRPVSRSLRLHVGESGYATVSLADDYTPYSVQRYEEHGSAL